jgi:CHAT domain-containing protein
LWMQTFYREAQLKPLAEAARLALRAVKSNPDFSHPYYWAAFTLITR